MLVWFQVHVLLEDSRTFLLPRQISDMHTPATNKVISCAVHTRFKDLDVLLS